MSASSPTPPSAELLLEHAEFLAGLAAQLVLDEGDAHDVVQETLLSAVRRPPSDSGSLKGWLARVLRNHAFQLWRSRRRREAREQFVARDEGVPSTASIVERENARRAVVEALVDLAEPYRSAILLRYYEDLPPREVARRLCVPVETVRTRLKRGLALLRGGMDRRYGAERQRWVTALLPLAFPRRPQLAQPEVSTVRRVASAGRRWFVGGAATVIAATTLHLYWHGFEERAQADEPWLRDGWQSDEEADLAIDRVSLPWESLPPPVEPVRLLVQVVGAEDGRALAGVTVWLERAGERLDAAISDDLGALRFTIEDGSGLVLAAAESDTTLAGRLALDPAVFDAGAPLVILPIAGACRVSGRTIDEGERALAFVEVLAFDSLQPTLDPRAPTAAIARVVSDADGHFTLGGLPTRFYLHARSSDWVAVAGFAAEFEAPTYADGVEMVLEPSWSLAGRVVDDAGLPIEGAAVDALTIDRRGVGRSTGIAGASWRSLIAPATRTRSDGSFLLRGVPPRPHRVRAMLAEFAPAEARATADGATLDLVLERGLALDVFVVGPDARPVQGAEVWLGGSAASGRELHTGPQGHGRFDSLQAQAPLGLRVRAAGLGGELRSVWLEPGARRRIDVVLGAARGVAGRVIEADGRGARGVTVVAAPPRAALGAEVALYDALGDVARLAEARSDEDGNFFVDGLPPGTFELQVLDAVGGVPRARVRVDAGESELRIELAPVAPAALAFRGRVVDALSGLPVPEFQVSARSQARAGAPDRVRGEAGRFELALSSAGAWTLSVTAAGYAPAYERSRFYSAGIHELDLRMWPSRSLELRIVDREGAPVSDARAVVGDRRGRPIAAMISPGYWSNVVPVGPRGEVQLLGLPARELSVTVRLPEFDVQPPYSFDLRGADDGSTRVIELPCRRSAERRPIELLLQRAGAVGVPDPWIVGRFEVELRDGADDLVAHFGGFAEPEGGCRLERPLRCLVQRFDAGGVLAGRSLQQLDGDSLSRDSGPVLAREGVPHVRLLAPLGPCTLRVTCDGFEDLSLEIPADDGSGSRALAVRMFPSSH